MKGTKTQKLVLFATIVFILAMTTINATTIINENGLNTSRIQKDVYFNPSLSFYNGVVDAHTRCGSSFCRVIFPVGTMTVDANVNVRSNTEYLGYGTTLRTTSDIRNFRCTTTTGVAKNVKILGFTFVDSNVSATRNEGFIKMTNCHLENFEIADNTFLNRSGGCIGFGDNSPAYNVSRVYVHDNTFKAVRKGLSFNGDYLTFEHNYLDAGGSAGVASEREGVDWNYPSAATLGVGRGSVSNNIILNFTEQGIDVDVPGVDIKGNTIVLKIDAATTTGINSYNNLGGVVSGNHIYLSDEYTDRGIVARSKNKGQNVYGNYIYGKGEGEGIVLIDNYTFVHGNTLYNLSDGINIFSGQYNTVGNNKIENTVSLINDTGSNNYVGFTGTCGAATSLTVKNGIITACS